MDSDGDLSPTSVPSDPASQHKRESEDEQREEPRKMADGGAETEYGEERGRYLERERDSEKEIGSEQVIRDCLSYLINVVESEMGQDTKGSHDDEEGDGWGISQLHEKVTSRELEAHVEEAEYPRSDSDGANFQSRRSPAGITKTPGTAKSKSTNDYRSRPATGTHTPLVTPLYHRHDLLSQWLLLSCTILFSPPSCCLTCLDDLIDFLSQQVRSETPGGSKFHLGSVLLPEKDEIRFQSAGGSGPVSQRRVNSSKRSSSALSDRDHEMHVSFDERRADVSRSYVQMRANMTKCAKQCLFFCQSILIVRIVSIPRRFRYQGSGNRYMWHQALTI